MTETVAGYGFSLIEVGKPLVRRELTELEPGPHEVLIEVAGCGVCHTDIGFAVDGVPTRQPLPLILGHEISGRVKATGEGAEEWQDKAVLVPAVIPCGICPACEARRPTICRNQFMPGNDGDGGFASHVKIPARALCEVPEPLPDDLPLAHLSVIADAVTTPFEAIRRSGLDSDNVAVFVGVGGVGGFGVQIAAAMGAAVVAIDIDPGRLELAAAHGASLVLNAAEHDPKSLKKAVRDFAKQSGKTGIGMKIFETSGTPKGQETAFKLVDFGGHLGVVGYTPELVTLRLSNLMALDATAQGNWGCPPQYYKDALDLVIQGKVKLAPYVELHPLENTPEIVQAVAEHRIASRPILVP